MRVLLAGASGAIGTPLTRQLIAAGHQVVGVSRSQDNAERLRTAGAEAAVADVLDRENLLTAVRDVRADAVMHQLTALGTTKIRAVAVPEHDRLGEEAVGADRPGGREEVGRPRGAQVVCALGCATDRA